MEKSLHHSWWSDQYPGNRMLGYSHSPLAGGDPSLQTGLSHGPSTQIELGCWCERSHSLFEKCRKGNSIFCLPCPLSWNFPMGMNSCSLSEGLPCGREGSGRVLALPLISEAGLAGQLKGPGLFHDLTFSLRSLVPTGGCSAGIFCSSYTIPSGNGMETFSQRKHTVGQAWGNCLSDGETIIPLNHILKPVTQCHRAFKVRGGPGLPIHPLTE